MFKPNQIYDPGKFEPGWQNAWEDAGLYWASENEEKPKFYCLDYFPYPSGEGLHVGHCRNYVPTDVISRFKRMQGFNVLHPMGWDAFGEPAEQNAIKKGVTPRITTDQNTANYKRQMQMIGTSYDWSREIDSSDPQYYRWTQWMFLKMYRLGLVYKDTNWQWYCPTCGTTLSSHEIEGDRCWRGHAGVTKREVPAWFFKITAYADELINGLDELDWPEPVKRMQRNWIGRSEGVEVRFRVSGLAGSEIGTFTTRPDTLFGVTFLALAPEHPMVEELTVPSFQAELQAYIQDAIRMSEIERAAETGDKTGVFTGSYAIHPMTQEEIPIYVADYVLPSYGQGAVMGVPAHDERDFGFANRYQLSVRQVIVPPNHGVPEATNSVMQMAFTEYGVLVDSGPYSGYSSQVGGEKITNTLEEIGQGRRTIQYRMRDWLISRQRYWGTPIPIIHCSTCGDVPVKDDELPVLLPEIRDFEPDGSGRSPLGRVPEFVLVDCPECGEPARRETDTLGGFACSSWYFLRFTNPDYNEGPFDPDTIQRWLPVDLYVGGTEHAVLHLLYARFWTKVLADIGMISFREPFARLVNQGQLRGLDGQRMSKSRGNVVNPDEIVAAYGADVLRIHGMFMAPFEQNVNWNTDGIAGAQRFLNRIWNLYQVHSEPLTGCENGLECEDELARTLHQTIQAVTERIEGLRFNTVVSALMEFVNELYFRVRTDSWKTETFKECLEILLVLLAPVAPYIAEELWSQTGHSFSVHQQEWPDWDQTLVQEDEVEIAIQMNGRVRGKIWLSSGTCEDEAIKSSYQIPGIQEYLRDREIVRIVYVPGKILNVVTRA